MRFLYARCVIGTFCRLIARGFDRSAAERDEGEDARTIIQRFGFHAIDITPCADGRLAGVLDHILRVPPSVVAFRKSYAGALFNVTETVRHWETVELARFRDGQPNRADAPTRFLKIGVYHFSSADPHHHGCAAHGSDVLRASSALLERLEEFSAAVRNIHGATAGVATLLVGVDTDTDAIRVHVPDASGRMTVGRYADSFALHGQTASMPREAAKDAIRLAVAGCAGVSANDPATEGMRWFCGYLLKNNIAQIEHVRQTQGGRYRDSGHSEKLIVVGDGVDDLQLRNLAFQAQMETVEEGGADLDVGVSILRQVHDGRGLAVPVLVHFRHDPRIPGSAARATFKAHRLMGAIIARHAKLAARKKLFVQAVVRAADGSGLTLLDPTSSALEILETES
jgi:carboxysome shell carbonic anhydrase